MAAQVSLRLKFLDMLAGVCVQYLDTLAEHAAVEHRVRTRARSAALDRHGAASGSPEKDGTSRSTDAPKSAFA